MASDVQLECDVWVSIMELLDSSGHMPFANKSMGSLGAGYKVSFDSHNLLVLWNLLVFVFFVVDLITCLKPLVSDTEGGKRLSTVVTVDSVVIRWS
jgi:hypothetical protein